MPFTIEAIDNQFAASTGSNVDTSPNSSRFDNPPQSSNGLRITTLEGDNDPRLFEVGDTYDITWGGGGGGTIEDAVVIRSDPAPGDPGNGVIVFSGTDENGDPAQIVWTPGFDLEQWYTDNYNPSSEPEFYTEDTDGSYDHRYVCFASEAQIRTPNGHKTAGSLRAGDFVSTKDDGCGKILWAGQRICGATGENAPVVFGQGSIGNNAVVRLSQQHRVLIKSPLLAYYFGLDEAFVPAKACVNGHDIRIVPEARICYVHILLEKHHVVWAEGLECESLFWGDQAAKALYGAPDFQSIEESLRASSGHSRSARPILKMKEAQFLMQQEHGKMAFDFRRNPALEHQSRRRHL